jgi:UDP-3-O-[3-hydroxymyristoyl] N-acetylglucosamine deacetylase/3-hydroxyacyl-[acyl-carrier-protein] dehydratase
MSALHGCQIDNALIELDGGEVPILDGSARPWMMQLTRVGVCQQDAERKVYSFKEKLHFEYKPTGSLYDVEPGECFSVNCVIDFPDSVIGRQSAHLDNLDQYASGIAPCRTFVFLHEIEPLLHLNLIKGGSLDNALVFVNKELTSRQLKRLGKTFNKDVSQFKVHDGVLNTTVPYFPNEPARHKLLDFVGDVRLAGPMLNAKFSIFKPGHKANVAFALFLMDYIKTHPQENN